MLIVLSGGISMRLPFHEELQLPLGKTALLLIDLQEEQKHDADYRPDDIAAILANARSLLVTARSGNVKVIHARYVRDFLVEPPRPFEATTPGGGPTFSDIHAGLTEICSEVAPLPGEPVFTKNDASAFAGTMLKNWLSENNIEWLMVSGVWTDACVAATVRDAIANGTRVLMVKDACGSSNLFMHQTALLNLANRLYGGGICDTERATKLLEGQTASVWRMIDPVPLRYDELNIVQLYDQL